MEFIHIGGTNHHEQVYRKTQDRSNLHANQINPHQTLRILGFRSLRVQTVQFVEQFQPKCFVAA